MRRKSTASCRGFTLIELAMVAAIVGILGLIAMPRYTRSIARYRVEAATRRFAQDMDLAQRTAVQLSAKRYVLFFPSASTYVMTEVPDLDHRSTHSTVVLKDSPYQATLAGVTFTKAGATYLLFDGFGTPSTGATITIQVGSEQRQVIVDPSTGKAVVQ